jgi:hypothetical protein
VKLEEAEGGIKDSYSLLLRQAGMIPKPMEMFSVIPELFNKKLNMAMYYRNHPKLDFSLLTCIRYAVALEFDSLPCVLFNGNLLRRQSLEESDLETMMLATAEMTRTPSFKLRGDSLCLGYEAWLMADNCQG